MFFAWFGRTERTPATKGCQPLREKLQVEALEDRFLPNAIRALPGYTSNSLPHEDDSPSPVANVGFNLNFFGVRTSQVFVNNNGDVTFGTPFAQFTPTALNSANGGVPIIAPFFADVDTTPTNGAVVTYGTNQLCGRNSFGVDYVNVGYFSSHLDKLNSFQVILIDRSDTGTGNFDIEFNYDSITWETGDASGGTNGLGGSSARVGFTNGTGTPGTFFELAGSGVNGAFLNGGPNALVSNTLLASTPGRYHFQVRSGVVMQAAKVNNDVTNQTKVFFPLRYDRNATTGVQTGNLTVVNVVPPVTPADACLDITSSTGASAGPLPGPITVVFTSIPSNIQLLNPSGFTASGNPFITLNVPALPEGQPCVRTPIQLLNKDAVPTTTFAQGFPTRVFSGTFDPTML
jgi:hypothetical protein